MRRLGLMAAVFLLVLTLFACTPGDDREVGKSVPFYYCRADILFEAADGVITPEYRHSEGYPDSPTLLFDLYFKGPVSDTLVSPFPENLHAEAVTYNEDGIYISVSSDLSALRGIDYSLACCCIAKTARALFPAENVYISFDSTDSGKRHTVFVSPDNYLLSEQTVTNPKGKE